MVGVARDFSTDARLFEDIHRLQEQWLDHADVACNGSQLWCATERVKYRIKVVHRVTELVQTEMGIIAQMAGGVKGVFLKETANCFTARQEVVVTRMQWLAVSGKDRRLFW